MRNRMKYLLAAIVLVGCNACTSVDKSEPVPGRWIRLDRTTQRFSIDATQVPRGALLDELKTIAQAEVRPQEGRDEPVTANADRLDLDRLVALLTPAGSHVTVRTGGADRVSVATISGRPKQGPAFASVPGAVAKPDATIEKPAVPIASGTIKQAAALPFVPREVAGPMAKAPVGTLLKVAAAEGPKEPLAKRIERSTVRVVLQFDEGLPPRVIDVQALEGRAPEQRFVVGTFLYAVIGADGRVLEAGTFQDPLVQRSYQPRGPHMELRAKSGAVGISIAREHLDGSRIQVVDLTGIPLPRELDEEVVRGALAKGRRSMQIETTPLLRRLEQGNQR